MKKILIIAASLIGVFGILAGLFFGYKYAGGKVYDYDERGIKFEFCEESEYFLADYGSLPVKPKFTSSDERVFTVDSRGNIDTGESGTATLNIKGLNFEYSASITVRPHEGDIIDCEIRYLCKNCDRRVFVKGGHKFSELTCEEDAVCSVCGYVGERHHGHKYKDADCENPKTCEVCSQTEGEPLGHSWTGGTCTTPQTCEICKKKDSKPLGHSFSKATCLEDSSCVRCGEPGTEKALGHKLLDADCTHPVHCERCDYTEGKELGHKTEKADCSKAIYCERCNVKVADAGTHNYSAATCTKPKTCKICKHTEGSALGHNKTEANCTRGSYCTRCNTTFTSPTEHLYVTSESGSTICAYCGKAKGSSSNNYNYNYNTPIPDTNGWAEEIVRLCNEERAKVGASPLTLNGALCVPAGVRAVEIQTSFSHTRPNGTRCFTAMDEAGYPYGYAGENIAYGYVSPSDVMNGWVNSSGHYKNIVNKNFSQIGIGIYNYNGRIYWVQMFSD